ncbi:arsenate reductase family protein [Alicyclobacillus acidiphilus]|uniref:arsenate reductase family protein n=1 Tax=Alicyclobacillus acidiphilus TaxID=182455 RepID=UPI00082D465C|nr:Spx/MgsR family RNA polymerase-binding regulatory protein [Alicyclobacillus acidiphilus]
MKLYGYKRCSTCREAQKTLEANGVKVEFHDIVEQPPSPDRIREWVAQSGRPIEEFVNTRGTVYRERDLKRANFTEDEWIRELSRDGKLLKRPILVTPANRVYIGYHEGAYRRIALGEDQ